MKWPVFTEALIATFECQPGKNQSLYWDGACPGLGVRVTQSGHKAFVFDSRVRRDQRDIRAWSITQAQKVARRYKRMTDSGIDPRDVRA